MGCLGYHELDRTRENYANLYHGEAPSIDVIFYLQNSHQWINIFINGYRFVPKDSSIVVLLIAVKPSAINLTNDI